MANPVLSKAGQVLLKAGYTKNAAAGILGNAFQESSWNPASVGSGGGGLWGFTAHPNSLSDLQAFAQSQRADWKDPAVQAHFLTTKVPASVKAEINSKHSPEAAALYFMSNWERPLVSSENAARRVQGANEALGALNGLAGGQGGSKGRGGIGLPPVPGVPGMPGMNVKLSTTIPQTSFDKAGYEKAQKASAVGNFLASSQSNPFDIGPKSSVPDSNAQLRGLFPQTPAPNPQDFTTTSNQTQTLTLAQNSLQALAGGKPLNTHPGLQGGQVKGQGDFATPVPKKILDVQMFAKTLAGLGAPYSQANHASSFSQGNALIKKYGTDCSGLVSILLGPRGAGVLTAPQTTDTIAGQPGIQAGRGQHITMWDRANAGSNSHIIIQIGKDWFESGGMKGRGVTQMSSAEASQELGGGGFRPLHPRGM